MLFRHHKSCYQKDIIFSREKRPTCQQLSHNAAHTKQVNCSVKLGCEYCEYSAQVLVHSSTRNQGYYFLLGRGVGDSGTQPGCSQHSTCQLWRISSIHEARQHASALSFLKQSSVSYVAIHALNEILFHLSSSACKSKKAHTLKIGLHCFCVHQRYLNRNTKIHSRSCFSSTVPEFRFPFLAQMEWNHRKNPHVVTKHHHVEKHWSDTSQRHWKWDLNCQRKSRNLTITHTNTNKSPLFTQHCPETAHPCVGDASN